ncbi:MAG: LLM class flavin-dependent oxidoreductase [Rubrobacteraceae bacterium]
MTGKSDYGRNIEFGIFVEPLADPPDHAAKLARLADREGLDLAGIQDHPYQRRHLDTWTLISTLVGQTENIRFFPDVANLPLRPPAVLAKAAASLDAISGGRVELGLGAGALWDAIEAMGGERRSPGEAVRSLEEAIRVIKLVWSGENSVRFDGEFYSLAGMRPGPTPARDIGVWVGAAGPKMLDLTGRLADGWVPSSGWATPDKLPDFHKRIDEGARKAGRNPASIRRVYNVSGRIGAEGDGLLEGPVSKWVERLASFVVEYGMDTFIFWPTAEHGGHEKQISTFAGEVVPAVKERVGKARGKETE